MRAAQEEELAMDAPTEAETDPQWWYWSGEIWAGVSDAELQTLAPDITCGRLSGRGALDPRLRIAVRDKLSMGVAQAQHQRYVRGNRGRK